MALLKEIARLFPFGSDRTSSGALSSSTPMSVPISEVSRIIGLPEEKVAQMIQMVRKNGMDEAQMSSMVAMASSKGMPADKMYALLTSLGVSAESVVQMMEVHGVIASDEADRLLARERERSRGNADAAARRARRDLAKKAAIVLFWLAVWQLLDMAMDNRLVLAGPIRVAQALADQAVRPDFWVVSLASLGRIALGFLLSFTVGIALALASYRVSLVRDFVEPVVSLLRTIPVISIIIMLLIWVGNQMLTIYLSFLVVLPLIYTNMLAGFDNTDPQMLEMARTYRMSRWRTFMYVYRPAFMPFLNSSSKISLGLTWKSGIMAEVLATPKPSIGKEMAQARTYLNTPDLFAWTVVVMVLRWLFERLFMELLKKAGASLGGFLGIHDEGGPRARRNTEVDGR